MLEGKVPMSSLQIVQAVTKPSTKVDLAKLQAKLVVETIAMFDEGHLNETNINTSNDRPLATKIVFLFDIATKLA